MRWPFHFGRSPKTDKAPAREPAIRRRDWESLPPIQRALGEPELTAPIMEFVESLAGSHDPDTSIEALGHHVSIEAPHGLVTGIASTATTYSPSIEMIGRPRRGRQPAIAQRTLGDSTFTPEPAEITEHEEEATMPLTPIRELPQVEPAALSAKPLTRLADSDRTAVLSPAPVQRAPSHAAKPAAERSIAVEQPRAAEPSPGIETSQAVALFAEPPSVAQRLTLGQARRLGLGAPLPVSAVPTLQRSTATAPTESSPALQLARPVPAAESGAEPTPAVHPGLGAPAAEGSPGPSPETTVQSLASAVAPAPLPRLPVLPVITRQSRSSASVPTPATPRVAREDSPAAQRLAPATPEPSSAAPSTFAATAPLVSSRRPWLTGRSTTGNEGQASESLESAAEAETVQLTPASLIALESIPAPSDHAQPAVPHRTETMPSFEAAPAPESPQLLMRPTVQRAVPTPEQTYAAPWTVEPAFFAVSPFAGAGPQVQVQREPAAGEPPMPPPAAAPTAVAPAPAPGAAPAHDSEKELDDLARKLHDRISARIRYDLLLDRERAGRLTDLR